jgi:membrane-associated phospholipid phosphatase
MTPARLIPERFPLWSTVAGACLVAGVLGLVNALASDTIAVDRRVETALFAAQGTVLRTFTQRCTVAGSASAIVIVSIATALVLWRRRRDPLLAAWCAATPIVALIAEVLLKNVVRRGPPVEKVQYVEPVNSWLSELLQPGKYSFPSGHATLSAAFATLMALLAWQWLAGWRRPFAVVVCATFAIGVAISRVVLGVHFLTDVVGGLAVGVAVALAGSRGLDLLRGYRSGEEQH